MYDVDKKAAAKLIVTAEKAAAKLAHITKVGIAARAAAYETAFLVLDAAKDAYKTVIESFVKNDVETLLEADNGCQAFKGLDQRMSDYPFNGKYDPPNVGDDEKCSEDCGPDFFGGLAEDTSHTILVALSGLTDKYQSDDESQSVWIMCAVKRIRL